MRESGVLLPLFSIRSPCGWGLGEIPDLVPFARWAVSAGFSLVQVLPVNEAARGQNSPYSAISAFAIDPIYLALDASQDRRVRAPAIPQELDDGDHDRQADARDRAQHGHAGGTDD